MKPIILILIAIVPALLTNSVIASPLVHQSMTIYAQQTPTWRQFSSSVGKFTVLVPGKPTQESNTDADGSVSHDFTAVNGETVYLVTYSDLVKEVTQLKPTEIFDAVCGGYAADGDQVVNQRETQLNGHPGRSLDIKAKDGTSGKASIYLIGNRLYQLLLVSPKSEDGKQFFGSFRLTEKK